jgi:outer membrane lipoprotein SlyB
MTSRPPVTRAHGARFAACLLLLGSLGACAPTLTSTTYTTGSIGRAASVSYGTIVGLRPVTLQGGNSGVGTAAGAVAGGVAGSFIGGDWRSNLLGGLGGAVLGGVVGNAVERGTGSGQGVEFFVRQDGGGDISVVQTNEENLQYNDRVVIIRGDTTRISRAGGNAPPPGYVPPPAYAPPPQGYAAPPTYAPPTYAPGVNGPTYYDTPAYPPAGASYR